MRLIVAIICAAMATGLLAGCGGDEGVAAGATVRAYFGAALCPEARRELAASGGEAGEVVVEAVCLAPAGRPNSLDLATVGANARRATQDTTAIAYVEPRGSANRFAQPIVAAAGIAYVNASSGEEACQRVLKAIESAGSGSLRDEVRGSLEAE